MPNLHWQRVESCQIEAMLQNHEYGGDVVIEWRGFRHVYREGNERGEHQHGGVDGPEENRQRGL